MTPSPLLGKLPERGAAILIAAASGRALAASARRAGYRPLVADFFDDSDTRELCTANCLIESGLDEGFSHAALFAALDRLGFGEDPLGVAYGAGFEDRVDLLDAIAERLTLFGNRPEVVRRIKDPEALAALCSSLGIRHPEVSRARPKDGRGWLAKRIGGSGGTHISPATEAPDDEAVYFQRLMPGDPVSVLLVADGTDSRVIGASRQWAAPAPGEPFRFGGSLRPADVAPYVHQEIIGLAGSIARAAELRGLNSLDFLVAEDGVTLIEVNPRPGATLDIFEDADGSLFQAHLEGCLGRLPEKIPDFSGAAAAGIAYARGEIISMPALDWPAWAADREKPRSRLRQGDPVCTIKARAKEPGPARRLVDERTASILEAIEQ